MDQFLANLEKKCKLEGTFTMIWTSKQQPKEKKEELCVIKMTTRSSSVRLVVQESKNKHHRILVLNLDEKVTQDEEGVFQLSLSKSSRFTHLRNKRKVSIDFSLPDPEHEHEHESGSDDSSSQSKKGCQTLDGVEQILQNPKETDPDPKETPSDNEETESETEPNSEHKPKPKDERFDPMSFLLGAAVGAGVVGLRFIYKSSFKYLFK